MGQNNYGYEKTFQKVLLCGRLHNDPKLKFTHDGVAVCNFGLVIKQKNKRDSNFIPCVVWGDRAKALVNHMKKGALLLCDGEFKSFYDKKSNRKFELKFDLNGQTFIFLDYVSNNDELSELPDAIGDV